MKQNDIIKVTKDMIANEAYKATVFEEIKMLGFGESMMEYYEYTSRGKVFGGLEILNAITGKVCDHINDEAVEEARRDINMAHHDIVKLLNLAGLNSEAYYKAEKKE